MSFFGLLSDFCVIVFGFWYATLDLYMALAKRNGRRPKTPEMLQHFVVMVTFLTITVPLDILIGSSFLYAVAKTLFVFFLVHRNYAGSFQVFELVVETLVSIFPQVVDFADSAHESELSQDVKKIAGRVVEKFAAEYQEIYDHIEDEEPDK
jgi:hypothetical protein